MGQCCSREQSTVGALPDRGETSNSNSKRRKGPPGIRLSPSDPTEQSSSHGTTEDEVHKSHLAWMTSPTGQTTVTLETATPPEQQVDTIIQKHNQKGEGGASAEDNKDKKAGWVPYDDLGSRNNVDNSTGKKKPRKGSRSSPAPQQRASALQSSSSPSSSTSPSRQFTPLVQVSESVNDSIIIEERDPEMPSDEESWADQLSNGGGGSKNSRPTIVWRQQKTPGSLGRNKPPTSPSSIQHLPPAGSKALDPPGKQAVHPDTYSQFQKLKLAAAVASQKEMVHAMSDHSDSANNPVLDQVEQDQKNRALYQEFVVQQERAQEMRKRQLIAQQEAEAVAEEEKGGKNKKDSSKSPKRPHWWQRLRPHKNTSNKDDPSPPNDNTDPPPEQEQQQQQPGKELLFDFEGQKFEKNVLDIDPVGDFLNNNGEEDDENASQTSRQSSLSLHSESSMEAQRKLFAEKARLRELGLPSNGEHKAMFADDDDDYEDDILGLDDEDDIEVDNDEDEQGTQDKSAAMARPDYGPVQHQLPRGAAARGKFSSNASTTSSTNTPGPVNMQVTVRHRREGGSGTPSYTGADDESSLISDLGCDEYSVSASSGLFSSSHQKRHRNSRTSVGSPSYHNKLHQFRNDDYGVAPRRHRRPGGAYNPQDRHDQIDPRFAQRLQQQQQNAVPDDEDDDANPATASAWTGDENEDWDQVQAPAPPRAGTRMGLVADRLAVFNRSTPTTPGGSSLAKSPHPQRQDQPQSPPQIQRQSLRAMHAAAGAATPIKSNHSHHHLHNSNNKIQQDDFISPARAAARQSAAASTAKKQQQRQHAPEMDDGTTDTKKSSSSSGSSKKKKSPRKKSRSAAKKTTTEAAATTAGMAQTMTTTRRDRRRGEDNAPRRAVRSPSPRPSLTISAKSASSPGKRNVDRVLSHLINHKSQQQSQQPAATNRNNETKFGSPQRTDKLSVAAMSTSEFLNVSDQANVLGSGGSRGRQSQHQQESAYPHDEQESRRKSHRLSLAELRGDGDDFETAHHSLQLAAKVEAQVETVLSNFRADKSTSVTAATASGTR